MTWGGLIWLAMAVGPTKRLISTDWLSRVCDSLMPMRRVVCARRPGTASCRANIPGRSGCTQFGMHMAASEVTLAESLKKGQYATYFLGKWHLGDKPGMTPQDQGFDVNIGGGRAGQPGSYFYPYKGRFKQPAESLKVGEEGEYLTDRLGDEAVNLIDKHDPSKPFLLYLSFYSVHTPIQAKAKDKDYFANKIASMTFNGAAHKVEGGEKDETTSRQPRVLSDGQIRGRQCGQSS